MNVISISFFLEFQFLYLGAPITEIEEEFSKKLDAKEKENSSTDKLLVELNKRYNMEKDYFTHRLQGLSGYNTMTAPERENVLITLVQMTLRGIQEERFFSCSVCVGLTERVQPKRHDR